MKTQLLTLSSMFILSFSGVASADAQATKENTNQVAQDSKNYHSQDIRNVQSKITADTTVLKTATNCRLKALMVSMIKLV